MTSAGNVGTVHYKFLTLINKIPYLIDQMFLGIVFIWRDGFSRRGYKEMNDIFILLKVIAEILKQRFDYSLKTGLDLIENGNFVIGCFLNHGQGIVDDKTDVHGFIVRGK